MKNTALVLLALLFPFFGHAGETEKVPDYNLPSVEQPRRADIKDKAHSPENCFAILVGETELHINKQQLNPSHRGQEKASSIKAHKPENPAESLPLDDVEAIAAIPEQTRLSKYGSRPLDYLLKYGTGATKTALKDHYPVNLISEYNYHLKAEINYRGYPVDGICQACQLPLLSQHSLTACHHPTNKHAFHTGCLSRWFSVNADGLDEITTRTWCPYCQEELPLALSILLSTERKSELHYAVESGNSAVVKALLESRVDADAENTDGNTPLWLACSQHRYDIVVLLLDAKADVNQAGFEGMAPLDIAVITSPRCDYQDRVIHLLLEKNGILTEQGARGVHDIIDASLQRTLISRFRQTTQKQSEGLSQPDLAQPYTAVETSKKRVLHCYICNTVENVLTVNSLPVCNDCLRLQAEYKDIYESIRKPEQKDPQINTITDSVYLGNYDFASDKEALRGSEITGVLVCGSSLKQHFPG